MQEQHPAIELNAVCGPASQIHSIITSLKCWPRRHQSLSYFRKNNRSDKMEILSTYPKQNDCNVEFQMKFKHILNLKQIPIN